MRTITVQFQAKPEHEQDLIALCMSMIEPSRAERGCIHYSLYRDLSTEHSYFFYEEWSDQEAINDHNRSKHFLSFDPQFKAWIVGNAVIAVRTAE
jgi:quinol monooxygenase YgiN